MRLDKKKERLSNILVWQWGRRGAGPKIAIELIKAFKNVSVNSKFFLSLSKQAEIDPNKQNVLLDMPVQTYKSVGGYLLRLLLSPLLVACLYRHIQKIRVDMAICTMPGLLDILIIWTLRLSKIPYAIIIHDAYPHPGERYFMQHFLQKYSVRHANLIITFSDYVYKELLSQHKIPSSKLVKAWHPPLAYGSDADFLLEKNHNKCVHLLNFGRLLPYKGFSLLDKALDLVSNQNFVFRIVGQGPKSRILSRLNRRTNVFVENRWVPEEEIASLIQWADAIILPYEEASQSGVLAIAFAFNKPVLVTKVGGLMEQGHGHQHVFLCEPNPKAIAQSIDQILTLPFPLQGQGEKMDSSQEWDRMAAHLIEQINEKLSLTL